MDKVQTRNEFFQARTIDFELCSLSTSSWEMVFILGDGFPKLWEMTMLQFHKWWSTKVRKKFYASGQTHLHGPQNIVTTIMTEIVFLHYDVQA